MFKNKIKLIIGFILIISCGSSRNNISAIIKNEPKKNIVKQKYKYNNHPTLADKIIWTAVTYKGTPYKYGGMTKKGIDCSGLIYNSFKKRNVFMPRTTKEMYGIGTIISLKKINMGDLLFFKTNKGLDIVNHVGLVTSFKNNDIRFIHSTTSKGVIVTSLNSPYWRKSFVIAKRVL